jgi:hypothetical protein
MADTCSNFPRHCIELFLITSDIERGIGVMSDQEGAGFQAHGFVRESHHARQFFFQLASSDFLEDGSDPISHFRLLNFRFLEKGDSRWADIDESPADGTDNSVVLIGKETNKRTNLIFGDHFLRLSVAHKLMYSGIKVMIRRIWLSVKRSMFMVRLPHCTAECLGPAVQTQGIEHEHDHDHHPYVRQGLSPAGQN